MSRLIFKESYIIVEPSYSDTELHKHSMLHVFLSRSPIILSLSDKVYEGNIIFLKNNILHKPPFGTAEYVFLVDPASSFADEINRLIPVEESAASFYVSFPSFSFGKSSEDDEIADAFEHFLSFLGIRFVDKRKIDSRILALIDKSKAFQYLGRQVSDIAKENFYSESWLTHLFKREVGVPLKAYLLMRQFEYVWKAVYAGQDITTASLDAGFSSPSHFSALCKKMTGISISDAL